MWLLFAVLSMLMWGLWGVLTKVALTNSEWFHYYVYGSLATFVAVTIIALYHKGSLAITFDNLKIILLASALGVLGYIFFVLAVNTGKASVVVPLTALYPAITAVLSALILKEELTLSHIMGIILAIIAIILLSIE